MRPFAERVAAAVKTYGPLCVGIDPSAALLGAWELADSVTGLRSFSGRCVELLAGVVPVVKPQVAFFERQGAAGIAALETLIAEATSAGLLVIADAKRGDIDTTAAAYADAWFDGPLAADALTASPYLGVGALAPMFDAASRTGRGVLVVVASSNPDGRTIQRAVTAGGATVEDALLRAVAEENRRTGGAVGAVVGATREPSGVPLSSLGAVLLAPGVGAQGATAKDVGTLFAGCAPGTVLPSASRSVLGAGPAGVRAAAERTRDELAAALT